MPRNEDDMVQLRQVATEALETPPGWDAEGLRPGGRIPAARRTPARTLSFLM